MSDDDDESHPALLLYDSLNFLWSTCSSADSFLELAEQRQKSRAFQDSLARIVGEAAAERANQRIRNGEDPFAVLDEFAEADKIAFRPPKNDPPQLIRELADVLVRGRALCLRARDSLLAGGADPLDAAIAPSRSIEIRKKVMEADKTFLKLGLGLSIPSTVIDSDAKAMGALAGYFEQQRDELGAVLELRGMPEQGGALPAIPSISAKWSLSPNQQSIWEALRNVCRTAKQLVQHGCGKLPEQIRNDVSAIRLKSGNPKAIVHRRGWGYFRPDAEPDWTAIKKPKRG